MISDITPEVVFTAANAYCSGIDQELKPFSETEDHWRYVCDYSNELLSKDYQFEDPSPFKVVAALNLAIAKHAEIPTTLSDYAFAAEGIESVADFNCPRLVPSIAAIRVGIALLHNAEVGPVDKETGRARILSKKIKISRHCCKDFAHTLSKASRATNPQVGSIALIFEVLAYKDNTDAEDEE